MILLLLSLVCLLLGYLVFLLLDLNQIIKQLHYINHQDTNAELVSTSKNRFIKRLLDYNNQLIINNKKAYRASWQNEKQFHQSISNLSHDLKTPLTISSGYIQLLLREAQSETKETLKKIDTSLLTIENYVNYLMEYNLIHEKKLELELEMINLTQLFQEEAFLYYENFQSKKMNLTFDLEENLQIISDATIVKRIFQNLLGNILKHGSGSASVKGEKVGNTIQLQIKNETEHELQDKDQLLNRFVTNDASRQNRSTGLGLTIIKELAELLNGEVSLDVENHIFQVQLIFPIRAEK
ncbi:HAMP domain-containing histidine kinase [Vagococcus sp. BWB3-3]|uniref:histidine kinase n=1 Tax=Vagococcus allomyrinae TaxID=2794353 RepID=A0A940P9V3_9ENTE|nr:HAMP domain-containing sensor histidine kinase [Vagococcus allomyrinae]MBP1040143.1 HAMP domain-containing histidine kinase [Vagococcus allomyrinae]